MGSSLAAHALISTAVGGTRSTFRSGDVSTKDSVVSCPG